jgi:16S rRNA (guanine527-N7)-methyltransferase
MFHVKHEGWELALELAPGLDDATLDRLEGYESVLLEQAVPRGMVAASDIARLRERHVLDALRAFPLLPTSGAVCDLGSGAGLPGLVLAIARPDLDFLLVEVRRNRASFLEAASSDVRNVRVHARRVETVRERFHACLARAFGPPERSWTVADGLLEPGGKLVYWAGASFDAARDTPDGATTRLFPTPALARSGPLAIMTRQ